MDRAGFYFMNWDDLYDKWMIKIRDLVKELEAHQLRRRFPSSRTPTEVVKSGAGPRLGLARSRPTTTACSTSR